MTDKQWGSVLSSTEIAIVGPCAAGKSTLRRTLQAAGYQNVRSPVQEHSRIAHLWRRKSTPDVLIYLDVDYAAVVRRRPNVYGGAARVREQKRRLADARAHANILIDTNVNSIEDVARIALDYLKARRSH